MSAANDGGFAFPQHETKNGNVVPDEYGGYGGMSLRDWFAGQAQNMVSVPIEDDDWAYNAEQAEKVARWAYLMADAMLASRRI
jgi:hypothetical protein